MRREVKTICGFCHTGCGMILEIENGKIVKFKGDTDHPANKGYLCPKGAATLDIVYSKDRLLEPQKKTKGGFVKISWDEALDIAADKLGEMRERFGPSSLIRFAGAPVSYDGRDSFMQFMVAYGSPNLAGVGHLCHVPRITAMKTVFGGPPEPDYTNTKLILFWGTNPRNSTRFGNYAVEGDLGNFRTILDEAKKNNIKTIVIDPVFSETAEKADEWIPIKPGTDLAMALAMLNEIITKKKYDQDFVNNWTDGFSELEQHVSHYTPEWAETKTGVPAEITRRIADLYASIKPALIRDGNGFDMNTNGVQTIRALMYLIGISGNYDVSGGNVVFPWARQSFIVDYTKVKFKDERIGQRQFPLFPEIPGPALTKALLDKGKEHCLIVTHANPALVMANTERVQNALKNAGFLMALDMFPTKTTELADLILPSPSLFESYGYRAYSSRKGGLISLKPKVIEPLGQCRHFSEIEYAIAKRLGIHQDYQFSNDKEWVNFMLKPTKLTIDDFEGKSYIYATGPITYQKYLKNGFKTKSGKMEIFSSTMAKFGQDPLPVYREPEELHHWKPGIKNDFPMLGTTRKPYEFVHTKFRNIPYLKRLYPHPMVQINDNDAKQYNVADNDKVQIESKDGKMIATAKVHEKVSQGMVVIDFGWGNPADDEFSSVNALGSGDAWDPISGGTYNRLFACKISKYDLVS